jgi:hypothetical protein
MNVVGSDLAFFRIRLSLPAGDLAYPIATLPVRLDVRDRDGALQPDAHIAIRLQPAGESSYVNGSAVEGQSFFVRFPAPGIYTIRADVTDPAFLSHWTYVTVWVVEPADGTRPPPPTERSESPVLAVTFLAVTSLVITATVAWWWRRTRKPH